MDAAQLLMRTGGACTPSAQSCLLASSHACHHPATILLPSCHMLTCSLCCLQYLQSALTAAGATPVPQPQLNLTFLTAAAQLAYPDIVQVCVSGGCMLQSCAPSCCRRMRVPRGCVAH